MLKKILLGVLALIILLLIIGFILPSKLDVSSNITVNASTDYVYDEVNDLKNWPNWSYWHSIDTSMKITYGAVTSGAGANYSWVGKDGPGSLAFTENIPGKSIKFDLQFMEAGDAAKGWYEFEPDGEGTKLSCGFQFDHGLNVLSRWFGKLMIEAEMKKAFAHELAEIKKRAEAKPKFTVSISQEMVTPVSYVGISTTMSPQDPAAIAAQMSKSYGELTTALTKAKVAVTGYPFALYPSFSETSMEMVCSLPVAADAKVPVKYKVMRSFEGKAVKAVHKGSYNTLESTHAQINQYIEMKKLEIISAPWEVYVTDPEVVKDTTQWITEVYYPVKN
jgi:effector-binding domain-containing protein